MARFAPPARVLCSADLGTVDSTDLAAAVGVIRAAVGGLLFWLALAVVASL
ncbi:MAG TPA: hypothetical protein PKV98_01725 [Burkholderiaceae bacterium]|nr:hypothetical protein [Burkholderiaceae bacterium]